MIDVKRMEAATVWDQADTRVPTTRWGVVSYLDWCEREAARMSANGIRAMVRRDNGLCAVYRAAM